METQFSEKRYELHVNENITVVTLNDLYDIFDDYHDITEQYIFLDKFTNKKYILNDYWEEYNDSQFIDNIAELASFFNVDSDDYDNISDIFEYLTKNYSEDNSPDWLRLYIYDDILDHFHLDYTDSIEDEKLKEFCKIVVDKENCTASEITIIGSR